MANNLQGSENNMVSMKECRAASVSGAPASGWQTVIVCALLLWQPCDVMDFL